MLHGQVAHKIGREIITGVVREGEFLARESELAVRFGVSRQAIREALKVLTAKGLLGSRRRTGTFVLPRSSWNLFDPDVLAWHSPDDLRPEFLLAITELRRVIEPVAAGMAARRGSPDRIAAIGTAVEGMRESIGGDPVVFDAADASFHAAIFSACGNDLIERLGSMMMPMLGVSLERQKAVRQFDDEQIVAVHEAVYAAIQRGNADEATEAMTRIIEVAAEEISVATGRARPA